MPDHSPDSHAGHDSPTEEVRKSFVTSATVRLGILVSMTMAASCAIAYVHINRMLREDIAGTLDRSLEAHLQSENSWLEFVVKKQRHIAAEYAARYREITAGDLARDVALKSFDHWMAPTARGRWIVKPAHFAAPKGTAIDPFAPRDLSGAIDNAAPLTEDAKLRHALGLELVWRHGPGFVRHPDHATNAPILDLYYEGPEESLLIYWPKTLWNPLETPGFKFPGHAYFDYGFPSANPERTTRWTGTFYDEVAGVWMASCITPVDVDGRHLGHFGCDIELSDIQKHIRENNPAKSDVLIFTDEGKLIAHSRLDTSSHGAEGFFIGKHGDAPLRSLFNRVMAAKDKKALLEDTESDRLIACGRIPATGWRLAVVQSNSVYRAEALRTALIIAAAGLALLGVQLVFVRRILRTEIIRPVNRLIAASRILAGGRHHEAKKILRATERPDELGRLSEDFLRMAESVRRSHEELEARVRERTAELESARDHAEDANRAKSRFLAGMSHELRTPLNAILGFAQLMSRDPATPAGQKEHLEIILKSGDHLLALINRVLDLAKIESGGAHTEPVDFDLGGMLDDLVAMLRTRAEAKGVELIFDQSSSFPRFIKTDRDKLRQILINLAGNALKFTTHGSVTLKATLLSAPAEDGRLRLLFEVSDTGPGIEASELAHIFKPFEQAKHATHTEGTGLGLSISREFARLLGGDITVDSEPGRGSVFRFHIVAAPADSSSPPELHPRTLGTVSAVENASDFRLLIVEDHPDNRTLLKRLLAPHGFALREAADGREALAIAAEWRPHLILMDRRMPVMDGLAATRELRRAPTEPRPVIVAVTAHAFDDERAEMLAAGCDDFLKKPLNADDLFDTLARHLPIRLVRTATVAAAPHHNPADDKAAARAAFSALPAELLAAIRAACDAADSETIRELIAPYPAAAAAAAPYLRTFRLDRLRELLPA